MTDSDTEIFEIILDSEGETKERRLGDPIDFGMDETDNERHKERPQASQH